MTRTEPHERESRTRSTEVEEQLATEEAGRGPESAPEVEPVPIDVNEVEVLDIPAKPEQTENESMGVERERSCDHCRIKNELFTKSAWHEHLLSNGHLTIKRKLGRPTHFNWPLTKRSLNVYNISDIYAKEILEYFAGFGEVQDFAYICKTDGKSTSAQILMESESSIPQILNKPHLIRSVSFRLAILKATNLKGPSSEVPQTSSAVPVPAAAAAADQSASVPSESKPKKTRKKDKKLKESVVNKFLQLYGKPEGGLVVTSDKQVYACRVCNLSEETALDSEEEWLQHLISDSHQNIHRSHQNLRKILWDLDRTIVINNVKVLCSNDILKYVFQNGPVVDFSYLSSPQGSIECCYALLGSRSTVEKLVRNNGSTVHHIGSEKTKVNIFPIGERSKRLFSDWRNTILSIVATNATPTPDFKDAFLEKTKNRTNQQWEMSRYQKKRVCSRATISSSDSSDEEQEQEQKISLCTIPLLSSSSDTSDEEHQEQRNDNACKRKLEPELEQSFGPLLNLKLEEQMDRLQDEIGWTDEYRNNAIKFIDTTLKPLNINFKQYPLGDLVTGMGLFSRPLLQVLVDVECPVDVGEIFGREKCPDAKTPISSMAEMYRLALLRLELTGNLTNCFNIGLKSAYELRCFGHIQGSPFRTELRIKFSNALHLQECKLFRLYRSLDVRVDSLSRLLIFWADSLNLFDEAQEFYSSQCILLLIIFFLQHKQIVPNFRALERLNSESDVKPVFVFGKNVSFCEDTSKIKTKKLSILDDKSIRAMSVLGLLQDWFKLFGNLDFKNLAICTRFGLLVERRQHWTKFCVRTIFEDNAECFYSMNSWDIEQFQKQCKIAAEIVSGMMTSDNLDLVVFLDKTMKLSKTGNSKRKRMRMDLGANTANPPSTSAATLALHDALPKASCSNMKGRNSNQVFTVKSETALVVSDWEKADKELPPPQNDQLPKASISDLSQAMDTQVFNLEPESEPAMVSNCEDVLAGLRTCDSNQLPVASSSSCVQPNDIINQAIKSEPVSMVSDWQDSNAKIPPNDQLPEASGSAQPIVKSEPASMVSDWDSQDHSGDSEEEEDTGEYSYSNAANGNSVNAECTLTQNVNLFQYFERAVQGTRQMKSIKLQRLMFQYLMDFNQKFWMNCIGFNYEPANGQLFALQDFAKLEHRGQAKTSKSVAERVVGISEGMTGLDISYKLKTNSNLLHKLVVEPLRSLTKKNWLTGPRLSEFNILLCEEESAEMLCKIRQGLFTLAPEMVLQCNLSGSVNPNFSSRIPLATLNITAVGNNSEEMLGLILILKMIYRKVGMTYMQKMVKRWLSEGSDFNETEAENFTRSKQQRWNKKARKNKKNKEKWMQKKQERYLQRQQQQ